MNIVTKMLSAGVGLTMSAGIALAEKTLGKEGSHDLPFNFPISTLIPPFKLLRGTEFLAPLLPRPGPPPNPSEILLNSFWNLKIK